MAFCKGRIGRVEVVAGVVHLLSAESGELVGAEGVGVVGEEGVGTSESG